MLHHLICTHSLYSSLICKVHLVPYPIQVNQDGSVENVPGKLVKIQEVCGTEVSEFMHSLKSNVNWNSVLEIFFEAGPSFSL